MLPYLIAASVAGPTERLLECLRRFHTKGIEACLEEVARTSILDIIPEAKRLALKWAYFGEGAE